MAVTADGLHHRFLRPHRPAPEQSAHTLWSSIRARWAGDLGAFYRYLPGIDMSEDHDYFHTRRPRRQGSTDSHAAV